MKFRNIWPWYEKCAYWSNKCINTYQSAIKIKHVDIRSITYNDFNKQNIAEDPKFEAGDGRVSKYKNIFANDYIPNWSEECLYRNIIL